MKQLIALLLLLQTVGATSVIPTPGEIRAMGRVEWTPSKGVRYDWSGTRFDFSFTGTKLALTFDDVGNHYEIYINDVLYPRIKTKNGDSTYLISDTLKDTIHTVRIERRTEQTWGKATLTKITLAENDSLLPAPQRPTKRFLMLGDSYTVGYGTEHSSKDGNQDDYVNTTNTALACGSLVGKHYDADYWTLGFSGKGLVRNANGDSPGKEYLPYYDAMYCSDINFDSATVTPWDHSQWKPHIIAINLGINDFSGTQAEPADTNKWVATYLSFIDTLNNQFPGVSIIVMATSVWPNDFIYSNGKKVVSQAKAKGHSVFLYEYQTQNSALHWHPSVSEQKSIADGLISLINREKLWQSATINNSKKASVKSPFSITLLPSQQITIRNHTEYKGRVQLYTLSGKKISSTSIQKLSNKTISIPNVADQLIIAKCHYGDKQVWQVKIPLGK